MTPSPELDWALKVGSGLSWTLVYILIIRRGFLDKTIGMPLTALCANISWEFIFSFVYPHKPPQIYINVTWFCFDAIIFAQALIYWKQDFESRLSARGFYSGFFLILIFAFFAVLLLTLEFDDFEGKYAAFAQNLMMSALFIAMLLRRGNVNGQSIYIALLKMIGTLLPSIMFFLRNPEAVLLNFLYIAIFTLDAIYIVLLHSKHRELRLNPWVRF